MRHRTIGLVLCVAAVTLVPLPSQALPACGSWSIVSSPNAHPLVNDNVLSDVASASPSDVWAVGKQSNSESPGPESTLAEHWNGTAWKVVSTPNAQDLYSVSRTNLGNRLNAVTAVSGSNVWAVGAHATLSGTGVPSKNLIEHWNGTAWKIVGSPNLASGENELQGIVAFSTSDIWAVGSYADVAAAEGDHDHLHDHPLALHWNGTTWKSVAAPSYGTSSRLNAVAKVPGTSRLWAVGDYVKVDPTTGSRVYGALIEKWDGSSWSVAAHTTGYERLNSVTAISSSSAFAVGNVIMRWNGTAWSVMPIAIPPNDGYAAELQAVTRAPNGNLWAAGWRNVPTTNNFSTLIERWDGTTWSVVASPNRGTSSRLYGIVKEPTSASSRVWAVGYSADTSPGRTLVETYC